MPRTRICAVLAAVLFMAGCQRPAPKPDESTAATPPADTTTASLSTPPSRVDSAPPKAPRESAVKPAPISHDTSPPKAPRERAVKPAPISHDTSAPAPDNPPPLRDAYHTAPLDTVDNKVYQGWKYYNLNCARCHGEDVQGTTIAPHLIVSLKPGGTIPDEATFLTTVCGGRVDKGMPAWCTLGMTPPEIDTIYSYVKGRSDAKLHPGRPARRTE